MSDDNSTTERSGYFDSNASFLNVYLYTQGGVLRRVSMPGAAFPMMCYALDPERPVHHNHSLDKWICQEADKQRCGYAEAFLTVLNIMEDDDDYGFHFDLCRRDKEHWRAMRDRFIEDMVDKDMQWRAEHDDWREPLPLALD